MCWLCDRPNATHFDYLEHVRDVIASSCFAVQGVEGDRRHSPWAYTVGLTAHGKPELVVTGWPMTRAAQLLNDAGPHLLHADAPRPGEQLRPLDGPAIEIVEVTEPSAHLVVAVEIFGPEIRALQLVHADDRGHWPWEVGFRGGRGGQPILGVRTHPSPADGVVSGSARRRRRAALASMHQFWPFSQCLNRFRRAGSDAKISVGPNLSGILLPAQV
jgi:hypothetical protein